MMNIAMGFDSNFAPYAAVTIKSILLHNKNIKFYIMFDNLKQVDMKKIDKLIKSGENCSAEWIDMTGKFDHLSAGDWPSKTVYFPVALPSLCPDNRILFLDADVIVTGNLENFYNQNMDGYYIAGAQDLGMITTYIRNDLLKSNTEGNLNAIDYYKKLFNYNDINDFKNYINGGVVLLNLTALREDNIENKMYESFNRIDFTFNEQDCYNYVCRNKIKLFSMDDVLLILKTHTLQKLPDDFKKEYLTGYNESKKHLIVHFIKKPWMEPEEKIPYKSLFYEIKKQTPYKFHTSSKEIWRFRYSKNAKYLTILGQTFFNEKEQNKVYEEIK